MTSTTASKVVSASSTPSSSLPPSSLSLFSTSASTFSVSTPSTSSSVQTHTASSSSSSSAQTKQPSFGKRMKNKFEIAKTWFGQKLGVSEKSAAPTDLKELLIHFVQVKNELETIEKEGVKWVKARKEAQVQFNNFNASIGAASARAELMGEQEGVLTAFSNSFSRIHGYQGDLDRNFEEHVIAPVQQLLKVKVKHIKQLKKQYDDAHLEFDSKSSKLSGLAVTPTVKETPKRQKDRATAKAELESVTVKYEKIKETLMSIIREFEIERRKIMHENLLLHLKGVMTFFGNSAGDITLQAGVQSPLGSSPSPSPDLDSLLSNSSSSSSYSSSSSVTVSSANSTNSSSSANTDAISVNVSASSSSSSSSSSQQQQRVQQSSTTNSTHTNNDDSILEVSVSTNSAQQNLDLLSLTTISLANNNSNNTNSHQPINPFDLTHL
eukprot:TRINITY_DN2612_c2_g1_i1.p1 TRINITY_DN2612_c2_g1~~TRINITY_DN2612_c2_g1_i1.p1  ORF type:complete len:438 (-),score=145.16 TRINITY_DN2612_c2_g1_i1:113-1426(-)